ncbi:MAG: DUF4091 domain-containing protein [Armatimonadetes bacterium]|nr:DUF4091 domain-containing protein [Armatimonadota bacterium]
MRPLSLCVGLMTSLILHLPCMPAPADGKPNLLANPGFEIAGEGDLPRDWHADCNGGSQAGRVTSIARTGGASGHIVKVADGQSTVAALVFPSVAVKGGTRYTLSGWGRGHVPAGRAALFLYQYDSQGQWLGNFFLAPVPTETDQWTPLQATETVLPNCATVQPRFEIYGEAAHGEAWVDDVYFGEDVTPPGPPREVQYAQEGASVRLTWLPPTGETPAGYQVFAAPYPRFGPAQGRWLAYSTAPEVTVAVPPGFGTYYAVCAIDGALNVSAPQVVGPVRLPGVTTLPTVLAWLADPDLRYGPELPYPLPPARDRPLRVVRGEYASLQVLVGAPDKPLTDVAVRISDLRGASGARLSRGDAEILLQEYVELPGQGRWVADPLPPPRPVAIEAGTLHGWWLLLHIPDHAVAGLYRGEVIVTARGQLPRRLPLVVDVAPVTVPRGNHYGSSWGLWTTQIAQQEQVAEGSPELQALVDRYAVFLLEHRMVPRYLPGDIRSEAAARWLDDERVSSFVIGTPAGWNQIMTDEQVEGLREQCDYLRQRGWLSKGYIYNFDEPTEEQYEHCRTMARQIRKGAPDAPILLTEQPERELYGAVDIWCPVLGGYPPKRLECRQRQRLGEHVWWYVCCGPGLPYPNYMLFNDPVDARALSWMQVKYRVEGELYWAATCFPGDVWAQGLSATFPGDGYLCYPGRPLGLPGPVTCIRAERIRDAKEDIELMWLLRQLGAQRGQRARVERVIRQALDAVISDYTHFSKHEIDYDKARETIVAELARLH